MRSWEKAHALSLDEAYAVADNLKAKSRGGMLTGDTVLSRSRNRYERTARRIEAQIDGRQETTNYLPISLSPVQRWLSQRALEWSVKFPAGVVGQMIESGQHPEIKADYFSHEEPVYLLPAGSRAHNAVTLAAHVLDKLSRAADNPAAEHLVTAVEHS